MERFVLHLPEIFIQLLAFALAISVHESAHGWMAERRGDPTARWLGRITLNPIKHIDPFGTVLLPLMLAFFGWPPLGWAKPVPFVLRNLRDPRRDPALLALAGPASNLAVAVAGMLVLLLGKLVYPDLGAIMLIAVRQGALGLSGVAAPLAYMLFALIWVNLALGVFNLIPIPPLDGSKLLGVVLPVQWLSRYYELERYGMVLVLVLSITGVLGRLLAVVLSPVLKLLEWVIRL